uniref:Glycine cleavage system H protein n=1 Tax=Peronospora matthiolae TaxID=2874970 RepID=A0AAV1UHU2_9STRA
MALRILSQTLRARALKSATSATWRASSQHIAGAACCFSTKYTRQHEYVTIEGKEGTIGITDFAQNSLGDVVYVDLPAVGDKFQKGDTFGAVESVKAASDLYTPASGTVTAVNDHLADEPNLVNDEAMTSGWFIKLELDNMSDVDDLLDEAAYKELCENEEH